MHAPHSLVGLAAAFSAVLIWGGQLPIAKSVMPDLDGFTLTLLRYGVASVLFVAFLWWKECLKAFRWEHHTGPILIGGAFGMGCSALLVFLGLSLTKPELAVIIIALQPGMTALGQWVWLKRRPPNFTLWCLAFAFCGVVVAVTRGGATFSGLTGQGGAAIAPMASALFTTGNGQLDQLLGEALVFAGAIAWVTYVLASSRMAEWSALRIATVNCLPATAVIILCWLVAMALGFKRWPAPDLWASAWSLKIAYVSVLGVFVAMMVWNEGARRIGPLNAMLLSNLMPMFTFAFRAMEGARFERSELLGAAMVVGALIANNLYQRRAAAA